MYFNYRESGIKDVNVCKTLRKAQAWKSSDIPELKLEFEKKSPKAWGRVQTATSPKPGFIIYNFNLSPCCYLSL